MTKHPSLFRILFYQAIYHCRLLVRMPRGIFSAFMVPVLLLVALHYLGHTNGHLSTSSLYMVIGPMIMGVVMTAYDSHALGLLSARTSGVLKRLHGTPLPSWCYFAGRIFATTLVSVVSSIVVLCVARLFYTFQFDAALVLGIAATVMLGAVAWSALGTAITRVIRDVHSGQTILSAVYLPLLFISGAFSPFAQEPKWMQHVAQFLPVRPISQNLEHLLVHASFQPAALTTYGILCAWALIGGIISVATFRWE